MKVGRKENVIKGNKRVDRFARAHISTSLDDSIPELDQGLKKMKVNAFKDTGECIRVCVT